MNKFLAVFFVILLFAGSAIAQNSEPSSYEITERTYTFYNGFIDDKLEEPFPLYFMNGVDDVPYVEL